MNRFGLPRDIPASEARAVRKECGFGCVLCGRIPYTYDHFDPEFADCRQHSAKGIALLCFGHHADRTAGRLSVDAVASARKAPAGLKTGVSSYSRPVFLGGDVTFEIGGTVFVGKRCQLKVAGHVLFGITAPEEDGEPWSFDGELQAAHGSAVLRFKQDEIQLVTDQWDVTLEGKLLQVNRGPADVIARVEFDGSSGVVRLTRLKLEYRSGLSIEVGTGFMEFRNLRHSATQNSLGRLRVEGSRVRGNRDQCAPMGVALDVRGSRGCRVDSVLVEDCFGVGANGVADLSAIATLDAFLSPDQLE